MCHNVLIYSERWNKFISCNSWSEHLTYTNWRRIFRSIDLKNDILQDTILLLSYLSHGHIFFKLFISVRYIMKNEIMSSMIKEKIV